MKRLNWIFIELIVALLVILWIYTGLSKFLDYQAFKSQLKRSPFMEPISDLVSILIPGGELLLSLLLIFKRTRLFGLYLSFTLMLLFTGYVWMMLNYTYDLPCNCGGVLASLSWYEHLVFNGVFTLLCLTGIVLESNEFENYKN